jgi:pilus assembly protein CpaB
MKAMTWTVVGLVVLGLVAALCAAILFTVLNRPAGPSVTAAPQEVDVVQATKALPAMTVIEAGMVTTKRMPAADAPEGCFSSPAQVIGKALAVPMKADQAFSKNGFAPEGSGAQIAATTADNMCVVMLSLPQPDMIEGYLYPGSVVDVVASFDDSGPNGRGPVATTLLKGVQVVAVEGQTIAQPATTQTAGAAAERRGDRRLVMLRVSPDEAQAVQLAKARGAISLSMRNPLGHQATSDKPVALADLVHFSPPQDVPVTPTNVVEVKPPTNVTAVPVKVEEAPPKWDVIILRGGARSTESFDMPPSKSGK